ncbi:MAG TPA: prolyl oligopeptidase family serine peptidase, partial [Thermoanaerobaculia bacterium]|nr:prolyl oligopeptidase family serine peptidase [Thermoanaerobaculia bacterium]
AKTVVRVFTLDGKPVREVELPGIGSAFGFGGEAGDTETFYTFTSFATPPTVYRYDVVSGESTLWRRPQVDVDPDDYAVEQVFYSSEDGTRVPMFVVHKKGVEADGSNPTLLYGYGGFNVSMTPFFSVERLAWLERGGVYAVANLRGGGEYGEEWHQAGTRTDKQNVFDDFIGAAEWLVDNRWTKPKKLAIAGGSNGGLLVGAAMTQRPDLFGAALPAVGVMDMLRFHHFTAGRFWVDDYGTADDPEEFRALYAYSPYHNLEAGTDYPPTLVTTADHDDRVVPGHSFKFAARLQEMHDGDDPVLIRIESRAGHGAGRPTEKRIEAAADQLAFLVENLDMRPEVPAMEVEGGSER